MVCTSPGNFYDLYKRRKIEKQLLENSGLVNEIFVCLERSLPHFVECGLIETVGLFEELFEKSHRLNMEYLSLSSKDTLPHPNHEETRVRLYLMINRVNSELESMHQYNEG